MKAILLALLFLIAPLTCVSQTISATTIRAQVSTAQIGPSPWIDVTAPPYNCVGNNSTDNAACFAAVAAAVVAGGSVYIPAGQYKTSATQNWNLEGLKIFGQAAAGSNDASSFGTHCSVYIIPTFTTAYTWTWGAANSKLHNGDLEDVCFYDTGTADAAGALKVTNVAGMVLKNVFTERFGKAGTASPSAPTLSAQSGGSLPVGTIRVQVALVSTSGATLPSAEATQATSGGNLTVRVTEPTGCTGDIIGWEVYATSGAANTEQLQGAATLPCATGTFDITSITSGSPPVVFNASGGTGIYIDGTSGTRTGAFNGYSDQPQLINVGGIGSTNPVILGPKASAATWTGGNITASAFTACGAQVYGSHKLVGVHFEEVTGWTGVHLCATGYLVDALVHLEGVQASAGTGVSAVNLHSSRITAYLNLMLTGVSLDSTSTQNVVDVFGNGTTGTEIVDNDTTHSNIDFSVRNSYLNPFAVSATSNTALTLLNLRNSSNGAAASNTACMGNDTNSCEAFFTLNGSGLAPANAFFIGSKSGIVRFLGVSGALVGSFDSSANFTVGSGGQATVNGSGKVTKYNNIATVSNGIPSELATIDLTAQTASVGASALYTPAATGLFRVSYYAKVTTAASTSSVLGGTTGLVLAYTDGTDSVAQTAFTLPEEDQTGALLTVGTGNTTNTTQAIVHGSAVVYAKTAVGMTYAFGYNSIGVTPMAYELHIKVEAL